MIHKKVTEHLIIKLNPRYNTAKFFNLDQAYNHPRGWHGGPQLIAPKSPLGNNSNFQRGSRDYPQLDLPYAETILVQQTTKILMQAN